MKTSYPVACPKETCGWTGNLVPSADRGGPPAEIPSARPAWFHCPRCRHDWEVRITNDRITVPAVAGCGG